MVDIKPVDYHIHINHDVEVVLFYLKFFEVFCWISYFYLFCIWTDFLYKGSYIGWLISSLLLIALALIGIVPVYLGSQVGDILSVIVAVGGLGAAGYHIPMHYKGKSEVCHNSLSYSIMALPTVICVLLAIVTLFNC